MIIGIFLTMTAYILIVIGLSIHFVTAVWQLKDLFTVSTRKNKFYWLMIIVALPLIGMLVYEVSKKRKKYRYRF